MTVSKNFGNAKKKKNKQQQLDLWIEKAKERRIHHN